MPENSDQKGLCSLRDEVLKLACYYYLSLKAKEKINVKVIQNRKALFVRKDSRHRVMAKDVNKV